MCGLGCMKNQLELFENLTEKSALAEIQEYISEVIKTGDFQAKVFKISGCAF